MTMIDTTGARLGRPATDRRHAVKRMVKMHFLGGAVSGLLLLVAFTAPADATALGDLAAIMKPGEWRELATSGFGNGAILEPPNGVSTFLEFTDEAQRNPLKKKIYIIGCARGMNQAYNCGSTGAGDADWIEYDENTNSWSRMLSSPINTGFHAYDHAAMDPATGDYYYHEMGSKVWKYSNGQLTQIASNFASSYNYGAMEFFPERNELVFVDGQSNPKRLFTLKKGASAWTSIPVSLPLGEYHNFTEYSAKHKLLFIGGGINCGNCLLMMDVQGNLTSAANAPIEIGIGGSLAVNTIDPLTGNLLVFTSRKSSGSNDVYEYNPVSNKWTKFGSHLAQGGTDNDMFTVAVPVPDHGVVFVVMYDSNSSKVYLYKHSAGSPPPADTTAPAAPVNLRVQ